MINYLLLLPAARLLKTINPVFDILLYMQMSDQVFPGKWQLHQATRRRLVDIEEQYPESLHSKSLEFEGPEKVQLQAY